MKRFAEFVIKRRLLIVALITVATVYFGYQIITKLKVKTDFSELLPQTHPYIKVHNEFRRLFGGANFLVIMVKVKEGDIFNIETLGKVKYITEELEKIPGVDRYKIVSIASHKLKDHRVSSWGMEAVPLMYPHLPQNEDEMAVLKNAIFSNEMYYGTYVSFDLKKTLIFADFFEEEMDYRTVNSYDISNITLFMLPIYLGNDAYSFIGCHIFNMGTWIHGSYGLQSRSPHLCNAFPDCPYGFSSFPSTL